MDTKRARRVAVQCIEAEIKRLAVHANLHDIYHADTPVCKDASNRRMVLRDAITALKAPETTDG